MSKQPWCSIHQCHPKKCFWEHNPCYRHKRVGCWAQYCKLPADKSPPPEPIKERKRF